MKILFIANLAKEHINKFHLPLIQKLMSDGNIVDIMCTNANEVPMGNKKWNVKIARSPFKITNIKSYFEAKKIIDNEEYNIIYCNTFMGGIIGRLAAIKSRRKGTKVVYNSHGLHFYKGANLFKWMLLPIEMFFAKFTDAFITINEEDYLLVKNKFKYKGNLYKVNGVGVDFKKFAPVTPDFKKEKKISLGFKESDIVITYVAEITKNKNQIVIIKAIKELTSFKLNIKLLLVGPIYQAKNIYKEIKKHSLNDQVFLTGWCDNVQEILSITDLYVASSIREGLGINVIEAMSMGIPVIVSDNRGHREIIKDGDNGLMFQPHDYIQLSKKIMIYLENKKITFNDEDAISGINKFEEGIIVQKMYNIILNI